MYPVGLLRRRPKASSVVLVLLSGPDFLHTVGKLEKVMNQRFDAFRRENQRLIRWVGTGESFEDVGEIMRTDSESTRTPEDDYVVVQSALGSTDAVRSLFEQRVTLRSS